MKHNPRYSLLVALPALLLSCSQSAPTSSSPSEGTSSPEQTASQTSDTSKGDNSSETSDTSKEPTSETSSAQTSKEALPAIDYVKVFAPKSYTHIWAWTKVNGKDNNLFDKWPGVEMSQYNDTWNTYDFKDYKSLYVIVSANGGNQSNDYEVRSEGYWWYDGSAWTNTNVEPDAPSSPGGGNSDWSGAPGTVFIDPADYKNPTDLPTPTVTEVSSAKDYSELPAVKNYNGHVVDKYAGSRTDFRDESIYFTITTRFYDGDKSNNTHCWDSKNDSSDDPNWRGDFKGLIEKMDYIKALGFTAIWITPVVKNASGFDYHGYHAINFKEVDPRYESEDVDFQEVIKQAHKRDMKIILDVVFNHTCNFGEENLFPMFYYDVKHNTTIKALTRYDNDLLPDNYYQSSNPGGLRFDALKTDKGDPTGIYHHDPDGPLSWEQYSETTGQIAGDCVDLNTENPTVANYLVEAYAKFIEMGVDAFRIDTMKHISRLTLNKYFFPAFKAIAKKARGDDRFHMFGEVCVKDNDVWNRGQQSDSVPFYTWAETKNYAWGDKATNAASAKQHWQDYLQPVNVNTSNNAYLNSGLTYHKPDHSKFSGNSVIDFPMHWNFDSARNSYGVATSKDSVYNDATYNVVYVDSHDYAPNENQTKRYVNGTNAWKENLSLMFTFRGVPCLYYGSEVEFKKGKTIDNGPNLALENSGRAYYGSYLEGNVTASGFGKYTASGTVKSTLDSTLSKHLRTLNKIRLEVPALRRGQYKSFGDMQFVRRYTEGNVDSIAAVAISSGCTFTGLPSGTYKEMISGRTVSCSGSLTASPSGQGNLEIWVKQ